MDERITFPVTAEEKQRLVAFAQTNGWSPTAAARFLCLAGLELEAFMQRRSELAKQTTISTKPRLDVSVLATEFVPGSSDE